jgi:hypothetical protein
MARGTRSGRSVSVPASKAARARKKGKRQITKFDEILGSFPGYKELPDTQDYFFEDVHFEDDSTPLAQATNGKQLFMGEGAFHRSWARLKEFDNSSKHSEVDLFRETKSTKEMHLVTTLKDFKEMALQYPFAVYQQTEDDRALRLLRTFVMYLYLDADLAHTVFHWTDHAAQIEELKAGLTLIKEVYDKMGGKSSMPRRIENLLIINLGVENIPQMTGPSYRPSEISKAVLLGFRAAPVDSIPEEQTIRIAQPTPRPRLQARGSKKRAQTQPPVRSVIRTPMLPSFRYGSLAPSTSPHSASTLGLGPLAPLTTTIQDLDRLSIEPSEYSAPSAPHQSAKSRGKRKADPVRDLETAKKLRKSQNKEDDMIVQMQEQLRVLEERKMRREREIRERLEGKGPEDYMRFYERGLRPRLRLGDIEEEREGDELDEL